MTTFLDESSLWTKPGLAHTNQPNLKRQSNELKHPGSSRPKKVRRTQSAVKVLQHHRRPAVRRKRRHLVVKNPIILHDNARSHTATAAAVQDLLRLWQFLGRSIRNINKDGRADGVRRLPNIWQKVVVITEDVQNVHLLLEYRPHIDVSLICEHDPKLQEYCVCPQNMPQFDSEGIPNQAPETNKPMILNYTNRNREGSDQVSVEAKQLGHLYLSIDQETFDPSTGEPYD
ncbi:hypothetical protein ANN_23146 [Periplaneta americana]|uniref:Uncharacterized protein n=1 Tax=Periplaneta americana TaxID=6978 RepID=A0ABQ8SL62_PERAM|nr:hypothetical protein ANN_23146 [Periplaneta americana]